MIKKYYLNLLLLFGFLLSCSDSIDPYGPYIEKKMLYGVLKSNSSEQYIYLNESYQKKEEDNSEDYSWINKCEVLVWFEDSVKIFEPKSITSIDLDGNEITKKVFYHPNFILEEGTTYEVWARFPDGEQLRAETNLPEVEKIYIADSMNDIYNPVGYINPEVAREIFIIWSGINRKNVKYFELNLTYDVVYGGVTESKFIQVPLLYEKVGNDNIPRYVKPGDLSVASIDADIFPTLFKEIKNRENENATINLKAILFDLAVYDKELSDYYYSTGNYTSQIPIEVDQPAHNNISNGEGLFGSVMFYKKSISFDPAYLKTIKFDEL